ncbi:MAG: hypothetical protein FRX49_13021 [Trebouxia sp. A1-2]|nr:MAG: hypothetical protein FRX49_13021 [Trebouxia sp. A1-2]
MPVFTRQDAEHAPQGGIQDAAADVKGNTLTCQWLHRKFESPPKPAQASALSAFGKGQKRAALQAYLKHGGDRQQEGTEVGVLVTLLCTPVHMQPNDGKDNHEEQDEAGNGQEGCRRCQQHFSDLTQALQQHPQVILNSCLLSKERGTRESASYPAAQAVACTYGGTGLNKSCSTLMYLKTLKSRSTLKALRTLIPAKPLLETLSTCKQTDLSAQQCQQLCQQ